MGENADDYWHVSVSAVRSSGLSGMLPMNLISLIFIYILFPSYRFGGCVIPFFLFSFQ